MISTTKDSNDPHRFLRLGNESGAFIISTNYQKESMQSYSSLPIFMCPQMGDVAPPGTNDNHAVVMSGTQQAGSTMTTSIDAVMKVSEQPALLSLASVLKNTASDTTDLSIKSFLAKPIEYTSGTLATTDTSSTYSPFNVFSPIATEPMLLAKAKGVFGLRATCVLTLTVNATRFQQGRYMLCFLPAGGSSQNLASWQIMHSYDRTIVSQLPHVEIDLATDTQVQLKIPYVSFMNAAPMVTDTVTGFTIGTPGRAFIYPYSPLVAGSGSTTASYTLWVHYEDVELLGNMAPQMGRVKTDKRSKGSYLQEEQRQPGFLETSARIVGKVASVLAPVPILSEFAKPVSWIADKVAGVASIFGWSSPISVADTERNRLEINPYLCSGDAKVNATKLSLKKDNNIDVLPGFAATDIDELSFNYLKDIYSFYREYTISTATADGALVASIPLCPTEFYNTYAGTTSGRIISPTPIAYLGTLFQYYRGGLKFKFKFIKTEFHSGRVMAVFFPYTEDFSSTLTWDIAQADYVHKTIIDLRSCNEFEMEVPYVSTNCWKDTGTTPSSASTNMVSNYERYGDLVLYNLQPLIAPSTVSSSIKMIVEVKGAADLSYAVPKQLRYAPILPMSIQSGVPTTGQLDLGSIGGSGSTGDELTNEAACIGEVVSSLRLLIKKPYMYSIIGATDTYATWAPWTCNILEDVGAGFVSNDITRDLLSQLTPMYALMRGSIRYTHLPTDYSTAYGIRAYYAPVSYDGGNSNVPFVPSAGALTETSFALAANGNGFYQNRTDWGNMIELPFYSPTHSKPCVAQITSAVTMSYPSGARGGPGQLLWMHSATTGKFGGTLMRHAGDDFNFGFFISTVPMSVPGSTIR